MPSWFALLCTATGLSQAVFTAVRVIISYRALEFGGDGTTIGVLTALYSLVPLLAALPAGRAVDRSHAAAVFRIGCATAVSAVVCVIFSTGLRQLAAGTILLGLGHLLTVVAAQGYVPLMSDPGDYDRRFGGLTVWISLGQSAGVPIIALFSSRPHSGSAALTETLWVMAVLAGIATAVSLHPALRISRRSSEHAANGPNQSMIEMLSTTGMRPAVFSSLIVLTSMDLTAAYLPIFGQRFGYSVLTVTVILTARAAASVVSRFFLTDMLRLASRKWLLISGTLCSALPIALIPAIPNPIVVTAFMAGAGFFWGLAQPLTMTWVAGLVSPANRASALSLRLTGNRLGQVVIPLTAGAVAGSAGTDAVFIFTGGLLASAALSTWRALSRTR
ncbi:MFS transporter [Nocardia sp. ET3-3]|uniref:MFS transporter n=1 Tax=Nocardia terrae TaxID=2675851 RepID=A0A7K1V3H7_9NOCA|nr:MFS transporter [Nocardia terrae]MVU81175.1 MFS transporter [Nocardia terrae]